MVNTDNCDFFRVDWTLPSSIIYYFILGSICINSHPAITIISLENDKTRFTFYQR